jgi:hypothetical protein
MTIEAGSASWVEVKLIFVEGETDCTSERARGQFSIFGAVEEIEAEIFADVWGSRGWSKISR